MHYNYNGAQTIIPLPDLALVYFDFGHISNTIKKRKVMILKKTDYVKDLNKLHLHCPICDFEYTHLMGVKTYNDTEGRLAVTLYFECEEKHKFEHDIHNHKGYTLITDGEE